MPLYLRILERLGLTATPNSEIVIRYHRVKVRRQIHILEVSLLRSVPKLSMVPIQHTDSVGLSFAQIIWQIVPDPRPEQRRDPPHRWQVILINVVEDLIVQRYEILELGLGQSGLGCGDVGQSVKNQNFSVLFLDTLEQHHYAVHDGVGQMRVCGFSVATPTLDLREDELYEDGKRAFGNGVGY